MNPEADTAAVNGYMADRNALTKALLESMVPEGISNATIEEVDLYFKKVETGRKYIQSQIDFIDERIVLLTSLQDREKKT